MPRCGQRRVKKEGGEEIMHNYKYLYYNCNKVIRQYHINNNQCLTKTKNYANTHAIVKDL